ncbi:MAG: zinc-ribbon domain-containing protein [Chloroflexi bacterium]|nr:zinc-ribbon domain-containing protein [Chloroflexota bacterium]
MIFLFGAKTAQKQLPPERKVCPNCLSVTEHAVTEHDTRLTLYFIPLISLKREIIYTCSQCGDSHIVSYDEYQAAHAETEAIGQKEGGKESAASGKQPKSARDKARAILEGRVVNGEIKTSLPFSAKFSSDRILKWMWIAFAAILLAAAILLILLFSVLSH